MFFSSFLLFYVYTFLPLNFLLLKLTFFLFFILDLCFLPIAFNRLSFDLLHFGIYNLRFQIWLVSCHLSLVTCHLSPVTCHLSLVTCHLSPVTCYVLLYSLSVFIINYFLLYNFFKFITGTEIIINLKFEFRLDSIKSKAKKYQVYCL